MESLEESSVSTLTQRNAEPSSLRAWIKRCPGIIPGFVFRYPVV